jgi:hypothetical protein
MPRKLTIHSFKPDDPRIFKIRRGNDKYALVLRIDILHKGIFIIYRKKALYQYLDDIAYGYL